MNIRRTTCIFAGLLIAAGTMAACSNKDSTNVKADTTTPGASTPESAAPAPPSDPVQLVFRLSVGSITGQDHFMDVFGNMIKQKYPNVTPVFTNTAVKTLLETGQPLDIQFEAQNGMITNVIEFGLQYDLTEMIKKYKYNLSLLEGTSVDAMRAVANGGLYGLPASIDSVNITYNKGLFDRFGVPYPTDSMTWEDMYELTRRVARNQDGVQYYGLGLSLNHTTLMDPLSPTFIDPKAMTGLLNTDKLTKTFQTLMGFFTVAGNQVDSKTWDYTSQLNLFAEHRLGMLLGPGALGTRYYADKDPSLNWDMAAYPQYKDLKNTGPQLSPSYFTVTSISKHKDMAFLVAAFITSPEMQKHLARKGYMPANLDPTIVAEYGKELPFMKGKNYKALLPTNPAPISPKTKFQALVLPELNQAQQAVTVNKVDINTALREANERLNKKIAEQLGK